MIWLLGSGEKGSDKEHEKTETARGLHDLPPPCVAHAGHPAKVFARDKAPRESEGIVVGHAQYPTR